MKQQLKEKICIRCGVSQKDVKKYGIGCKVWVKYYKKHKYEIKK